MSALRWENVDAVPLIHGRLPFALEVRRQMLDFRYTLVAVELPPSLQPAVEAGLDDLPLLSMVIYRERPDFLDDDGSRTLWYVPLDPADGMVEAMRVARGERTPVVCVDAEVEAFRPRPLSLPDPHAVQGLGLERYWRTVSRQLPRLPRGPQDKLRERHMAARLAQLSEKAGTGRILFICGLAHWAAIREHLQNGTHRVQTGEGPAPELVSRTVVHPRSLMHVMGEMPAITWLWEQHRSGIDPAPFDPVAALKSLLLRAREAYEEAFPDSLEKAGPRELRNLLRYLRKLVVGDRRLFPDAYSLTLAARGTVGNDFAVKLLETAHTYPPNEGEDDGLVMTENRARVDETPHEARSRVPGEARSMRRLRLHRRPDRRKAATWARGWNPHDHCSWPPEDDVIERFRAHVTRRALTVAGLELRRTEPFSTSFKDGIAVRESLRDWHMGKIHVKEEPPAPGQVGALVAIFEEDDEGTRFPWRSTWMAEHPGESTLAFYATDPRADMVGPGIGRMFYGGCLFIYPPIIIPDVWDDLRFEQARRPSERLLLAALFWSRDRFVAHLGPTPPAPEVKAQAQALGRHVVHLPLSGFSSGTLERMRRAHVLNGRKVRSWAARFIH